MVSAFASQLQAIAANSTHELDLKARRTAHGESLLFERPVAVKQDFNTIYHICHEGYRELCQLDDRFSDFERNLFSEQSKDEDREQMTKAENEALDLVLKRCLSLLGGRILLKPAQKALEWLVRRFRVHVYNVDQLLLAVLPYHEIPIWANVLSIIPNEKIVGTWKFIRPYLKTTWNVPRHAVAYAAANNDAFFSLMNNYVLETCQQGLANAHLMRFWSSLVVEAIATRLNQTRSGRKEVQNQRTEDLLRKILPLLSDGFEVVGTEDLTTTCYTITIVLAAKADLADHLLDSLLLAVAQTLDRADHDTQQAFITMLVLADHKKDEHIPRKVLDVLAELETFSMIVRRMAEQHPSRSFLLSLIKSTTAQIKRKNAHKFAGFVDTLVRLVAELYPTTSLSELVQPLISKIMQLEAENEKHAEVRQELILRLQSLNEDETLSVAIASAADELKHDAHTLENILGMTITLPEETLKIEDVDGDVSMVDSGHNEDGIDGLLTSLPQKWSLENSFLAFNQSDEYDALSDAFEKCCVDSDMLDTFSSLAVWKTGDEQELRWQTFLLRFACSGRPISARTKALTLLAQSSRGEVSFHLQHVIPYILALLGDAKPLRNAALALLSVIQEKMTPTTEDVHSHHCRLYAPGKLLSFLGAAEIQSLISDVLEPVSQECLLDATYIGKTVHDALSTNSHNSKKSHKSAMGTLLIEHVLATPLMKVKVNILSMLDNLQKIGKQSKAKALSLILQEWSAFTDGEAQVIAQEAGMTVSQIDSILVKLADVHDKHFFEHFTENAASSSSIYRKDLVLALFYHLRTQWSTWNVEQQITLADVLFDLALSTTDVLASTAQDVLRNVDLPAEVLAALIKQSQAGTSDVRAPASKRRKRSSSSGATTSRTDAIRSIDDATAKLALVLELVHSNAPETKPGLADVMFELLGSIRQLQQNRIDSPYLLNLCLSTLHAMMTSAKARGQTVQSSSIKPELVTDCLRHSDNLQVQNSALLLLAALSTIVPDKMVHNVMPVFTFIGHNMLYKDDEHSVNVINEAIDKIVPALLENLRRGRNIQSYQSSVAIMLASFTAAYDHIPLHRRVAFYQKLLNCINADDFGYMLVALVSHQQRKHQALTKFVQDLMASSRASTQLKIYRQLLQVAIDVLSSSPKISVTLFNIQKSTSNQEKHQHAVSCFDAALKVIGNSQLAAQVQKRSKPQQSEPSTISDDIQLSFRVTLSSIQATKGAKEDVASMVKQCMDHLLGLPSLADLLDALASVLDEMPADLKPQALRMLALQFTSKKTKDARAQQVALEILQKLHQYLRPSTQDGLLLASLACVDQIVEAYGRKNPDAVLVTAQHILDEVSFNKNSPSEKRSTAVILTIAGIVEVLKEASVPLVSSILEQAGEVLERFGRQATSYMVFSALCTLLSAVFSHVSFVIAQDQLNDVLGRLVSARLAVGDEDFDDYVHLRKTISRKVDLDMTVSAVSKQVGEVIDAAEIVEYLALLAQATEASPKSVVVKSAELISQVCLAVLETVTKKMTVKSDNRGVYDSISEQLKDTSIKFIYKVNDTTFRPVFESWVDWATTATRQIVLFELLTHFFDTLKAIVTSYASYLLRPISTILQSATSSSKSQPSSTPLPLVLNTLTLIRTAASHDQDSFFAAPSHFDPIAPSLISCLNLAATKATRPYVASHVIPTIVSLATATIDSPSTHSTLTHHIVKLKSVSSAHVRLASIRTLLAMTEDEDLGDEFVANVVGTGAGEGEGARGGGGSIGEVMVYVNEMLEDDDEDVEHDVRRWVQLVRSKVGEDTFEV